MRTHSSTLMAAIVILVTKNTLAINLKNNVNLQLNW